ncbi:MAG: hypothetical protein V1720_19020 [bacterium]
MKTSISILMLLVLCFAINAQILDGKWKGNMSTPNGDFELTFTFKVNEASLSGDVESQMGTLPIENGKVNETDFTFDVNVNGQVINHTGKLEGDVVKLSFPMAEQPMELTRVVEKSKIDGIWIGKTSSPQGEMEITFTFIVNGGKLTGKNSSAMGEIDLTNGVVNGNDFSFDVELQGMKIVHNCKYLADDTIDMKAVVMDQEMPMKLTRVTQ